MKNLALSAGTLAVMLLTLAGCGGGGDDGGSGSDSVASQSGSNALSPSSTQTADGATYCPYYGQPIQGPSGGTATVCAGQPTAEIAIAKINAARKVARYCGTKLYPAAPPLVWNETLYNAALVHAKDLATDKNTFDIGHTGSDGSSPSARTKAAGYGAGAAENVTAKYTKQDVVIENLLESPGHCANIMNPNYKEYAIACGHNPTSYWTNYWVQLFSSPPR